MTTPVSSWQHSWCNVSVNFRWGWKQPVRGWGETPRPPAAQRAAVVGWTMGHARGVPERAGGVPWPACRTGLVESFWVMHLLMLCFYWSALLKEHGAKICPPNYVFFDSPVLQPAVEAFFLVHATERESKPPVRDTRESQLSHIKDEPPPLSPAPLTPATPSSLDPFFSREPSSMHISSNLPPDTQKFLRFAGEPDGLNWGDWYSLVLICREVSNGTILLSFRNSPHSA